MTLIASHRGGRDLWPENSRLAFLKTAEMDVELVEFDVHQTRDNVLVVHHDALIDRMTDGKGAIADYTYEELKRFVIIGTGGETIPTLGETIEIFKPTKIDLRLEIKTRADGNGYEGMERRIVDELLASEMLERTMITSFQMPRLKAFLTEIEAREIERERLVGIMWLCAPAVSEHLGTEGIVAALNAQRIREIGLRADKIEASLLQALRSFGITVHAWAAHSREAAEAMFEYGIASFTTDRPDLAVQARVDRILPDTE